MNTVPIWLKKRIIVNSAFFETKKTITDFSLNTVCESAACPNINECFSKKHATFMILGKVCTRVCSFCSVAKGPAEPVDTEEPGRIAGCAARLGLKYVIITSVTRDDLHDGGAGQFINVVKSIRSISNDAVIELLIPDFAGNRESIKAVALSGADIIGHNIETVNRLYPIVRRHAEYQRSLQILKLIKAFNPSQVTKSAILAGMGETEQEIVETMRDIRRADCNILTIGQYLKPDKNNHPVDRFVTPDEFMRYMDTGKRMGFGIVSSAPFVRSSYCAEEEWRKLYDKCYAAAVS